MTFGIRRLAQIPRTARIIAILAAVLALLVPIREVEAVTMPVVVNDVDFAGDVYEFSYHPKTATDHNVTLTNTGWAGPFSQAGVDYWQSTGLISGELTMGWDFTGLTKPIAKIELGTRNHLFQLRPGYNTHSRTRSSVTSRRRPPSAPDPTPTCTRSRATGSAQ